MKHQEARFILRAYRGDGRYGANDPLFAEALAEAEHSPALAEWQAREEALDSVLAAKLDDISPPPGLREAILVGARASRLDRRWWKSPSWLAAAAAVAVLLSVFTLLPRESGHPLTTATLTEFSLRDVSLDEHSHEGMAPGAEAIFQALSQDRRPVTAGYLPSFSGLDSAGCSQFRVAGREVLEVCFERNGAWFHLYAARRAPETAGREPTVPAIVEKGQLAAVTWAAGDTVYSVATNEGIGALRSIL